MNNLEKGSILSSVDIIKNIIIGNIIIYNPDIKCTKENLKLFQNINFEDFIKSKVIKDSFPNLENCSYDISLGEYYYKKNDSFQEVFNPNYIQDFHSYWELGKVNTIQTLEEVEKYKLKINDQYIILQPNEFILAHSNEFIGGRNNITTMLKCKSTMARAGIAICNDAGWGDIGYINRWTLEIKNFNSVPIVLRIGQKIGQIIFLQSSIPLSEYQGKYQDSFDIYNIIEGWNHKSMLPKIK